MFSKQSVIRRIVGDMGSPSVYRESIGDIVESIVDSIEEAKTQQEAEVLAKEFLQYVDQILQVAQQHSGDPEADTVVSEITQGKEQFWNSGGDLESLNKLMNILYKYGNYTRPAFEGQNLEHRKWANKVISGFKEWAQYKDQETFPDLRVEIYSNDPNITRARDTGARAVTPNGDQARSIPELRNYVKSATAVGSNYFGVSRQIGSDNSGRPSGYSALVSIPNVYLNRAVALAKQDIKAFVQAILKNSGLHPSVSRKILMPLVQAAQQWLGKV